jgi:hypothetical protein
MLHLCSNSKTVGKTSKYADYSVVSFSQLKKHSINKSSLINIDPLADKDTAMRDRQRRRQVELEIMILNLLIDYINGDIPGRKIWHIYGSKRSYTGRLRTVFLPESRSVVYDRL